jgi:signal-transduction protein with cAMP-binding, CBS, and nucleotidyltransferase domain
VFQEFLKQVQLFSQLNKEQINMISAVCIRKNYKAGTVLFKNQF